MVSASHNPMPDNGIKFFARGGLKLADDVEDEIEAPLGDDWERPTGADVGRITHGRPARRRALRRHLLTLDHADTASTGCASRVDCANGAASEVGPEALRAAGADVVVINA